MVKIKSRTVETGQTMGTGAHYDWYLCDQCKEWVHIKDDPGRWTPSKVYCGHCTEGYSSVTLKFKKGRGPILSLAPAAYAFASLMHFPEQIVTKALTWTRRYLFVGIMGDVGRGKTHLAWAIEKEFAGRGLRIKFLEASEAKLKWYSSFDRQDILKAWMITPYLIIDDFTRAAATEGWSAALTDVLDFRTSNSKPTLLTTMSSGEEVERLFGRPLRSRLAYFNWIILKGPDLRKLKDNEQDKETPNEGKKESQKAGGKRKKPNASKGKG